MCTGNGSMGSMIDPVGAMIKQQTGNSMIQKLNDPLDLFDDGESSEETAAKQKANEEAWAKYHQRSAVYSNSNSSGSVFTPRKSHMRGVY